MTEGNERTALRLARVERGWSQSRAGAELRELAKARGGPDASAASLKTQLSRWENAHAMPEPEYRELLAQLYGRTAEQLGLVPAPDPRTGGGSDRLRADLAAAAAVDDTVVVLWIAQLAVAQRLDDELGAAGAGELVGALVEQLVRTLSHTVSPSRRVAVARVLADAAVLAGSQALDRGDPEAAWHHHGVARSAAREASAPWSTVAAAAGQAEVLRDVGAAQAAVELLDHVEPTGPPVVRARLAAARGLAFAATGDAPAARRALDVARRTVPAPDIVHPPPGAAVELADLHRWHGKALLTLNDPEALGQLQSALAAGPSSVRHRATLHADLALALEAGGRPDEATEHAFTARQLAERIGSRRVVSRLAEVGRGLR